MEGFFAGVGAMVITSRAIFWLCALSYIAFSAWSAHARFFTKEQDFPTTEQSCKDTAKILETITLWTLITNLLGLFGGAGFYYCEKGETVSVLGGLIYFFNFISMIVLFIYGQIKLFSDDIGHCSALVKSGKEYSFPAQKQVLTFYIGT